MKTGGGFVGGGFGVVGAMEGMAIAAVLNALTTRSSIKTVLRVQATASELFLLYGRSTPEKLRIDVSRALAAVRAARARRAHGTQTVASAASASPVAASESPVAELSKLAEMLQAGLLTREEFEHFKTRLLQG